MRNVVSLAESGTSSALIAYYGKMSTVDYAALLLSLPTSKHLRSPGFLSESIVAAVNQTEKSLIIIVFSPLFSSHPPNTAESLVNAPVHSWATVQNLLTFIYVEAAREVQRLDKILLNVDVVLHDSDPASVTAGNHLAKFRLEQWEAVFTLDGGLGTSKSLSIGYPIRKY